MQTFKTTEVDHIEEPPARKAVSNETGDATIDRRSKDYERWLDTPLAVATSELTVVRGDHPVAELRRMAEAAERTARHFLDTFGCQPVDAVHGDRYGPGRIEIFQFLKEDGYLAFCDKVLARTRDETVDDARLAFMKRQRGLWIETPRSLMAQYQGPSDVVTLHLRRLPQGEPRDAEDVEALGCLHAVVALRRARVVAGVRRAGRDAHVLPRPRPSRRLHPRFHSRRRRGREGQRARAAGARR